MSQEHHRPPARKPNHNGWTPARRQLFLEHLADVGSVSAAARAAGMSKQSAYWLRRQPHAQDFARAWEAALADTGERVEALVMERIIDGEEEVIERDGETVMVRRRPCDVRLLLHHLKRLDDRRSAHHAVKLAIMQRELDRQNAATIRAINRPDSAGVAKLRAELRALADPVPPRNEHGGEPDDNCAGTP